MSDIEASWEKKYNLLLLKMAQDKQDSDLYFKMLNEALEENKQLKQDRKNLLIHGKLLREHDAELEQKLEALRGIAEQYRNHCIKPIDKILEVFG